MTMPKGYTFVGKASCPNSKVYAHFINQYCALYPYKGQPLDARYVATLISAEVGNGWNTNSGSSDYATTHSAGLGQFTDSTGPSFGLNTQAKKEDPNLCIKAICNYYRNCLISASKKVGYDNPRGAYEEYNGGPNGENVGQAQRNTAQNWDPAYKSWFNNSGIAPITGTGGTPAKNNNATNAANDAAKKAAAQKASADLAAKNKAAEAAKTAAINAQNALNKAKLTKNKDTIAKAQKALDDQKKNKVVSQTQPTSTTKKVVLKSGFGILGLLATLIFLNKGYDL